jgi:peptidoglycan/LPS O-acetylase OafA/YrhL
MSFRFIPALTGIRAVAAYLVFFYHFNPLPESTWGGRLLHEGHIGVPIFFVLSGSLITLRYWDNAELSWPWLKRYIINRFARIYPLYALITIVTFLFIWHDPAWDGSFQWKGYTLTDKVLVPLLNLTFLRGFFEQFIFTGVGAGWSLTVEETFYVTAPLLLITLGAAKQKYVVLALVALAAVAIGCGLVLVLPHRFGLFVNYQFMFAFTFFGRAVEFMVGAALSLFVRSHFAERKGLWYTAFGATYIVVCMVALSTIVTPTGHSTDTIPGMILNNFILPIGVAVFFYGLITEHTWLSRLLEAPIAQLAGKTSYAFYLVHWGILSIAFERHNVLNVFVLYVVALLVSWALWKWVEEPLNKRLRRLAA